jgi:hypothetical protein
MIMWHSDGFLETRAIDIKANSFTTGLDLNAYSSTKLKLRDESAPREALISLLQISSRSLLIVEDRADFHRVLKDPLCVLDLGGSDQRKRDSKEMTHSLEGGNRKTHDAPLQG